MARVSGQGSDGALVMVGRTSEVAEQLHQNDCPYLINMHCGAHRIVLAAHNVSKAVPEMSAYVTTINNIHIQ